MQAYMAEVGRKDLIIIKEWIEDREFTRAGVALSNYLADASEDVDAWYLMGELMLSENNAALAALIYEWTCQHGGSIVWQHWNNWGKALDHLNRAEEAEERYRHALSIEPENAHILTALATNLVAQYRSEECIELAKKALEIDPTKQMARSTLGFAYVQMRDWANGWDYYEHGYGKLKWRTERSYNKSTRWTGQIGETVNVAVHAEQGIGDQVAGVEALGTMARKVNVVSLEVDAKLETLMARSFPEIEVHGSLQEKDLEWPTFKSIDHHTGLFSMHRHFRRAESDYTGEPYLIACPERRLQWRALLDSLGPEPKVGLAWSGGVSLTQRTTRRADLGDWLPILKQPCHWVNLEYRDRSDDIARLERLRGIKINDWPWATRTDSYDDTAALVAELDLVICVPTTIVHCAGALGTPVFCMVHPRPNLHYSGRGDTIAYYGNTVRLFRRETNDDWRASVRAVATALEEMLDARCAA